MLEASLFYFFAFFSVVFALGVLLRPNPLFAALNLVLSMTCLAGLFFNLGSYFLAAVQLAVYAGAVMVLFIMVLMVINPKDETKKFSSLSNLSTLSVACIAGALIAVIANTSWKVSFPQYFQDKPEAFVTKDLAKLLFDNYVLPFEVLGVLLLVIAIGVVSVSRIKGGTHESTITKSN